MIRYWPVNNRYDVLMSFNRGKRVESLHDCDFQGVSFDKYNDVNKKEFKLLGAYVISNWSEEE